MGAAKEEMLKQWDAESLEPQKCNDCDRPLDLSEQDMTYCFDCAVARGD